MSEVWNHFYMAPNGLSVNCNHCGKFMKRSDSSTKSMWGHLKAFHADLVGEETFRLKRTRRMRGSSGATSAKKSGKKGSKKGQQQKAAAQQRRMAAEAAAASGSSSSGSSSEAGEEDERQSEFSGASSRGTTPTEQLEAVAMESAKVGGELAEKNSSPPANAALSIQSLLELGVAELEKSEKEKEKEMATIKQEEPIETPTQPYVKRKRQQNGQPTNQGGQSQQPPIEQQQPIQMEQPAAHPAPAQEEKPFQNVATPPPPPPAQPKKSPSPINPADDAHPHGIPHSGNHSAFSKYSTAALLQQAQEGGKKSPAHGAEAPKPRPQTQPQSVAAPRSAYGLEAMTGLSGQQLGMLGLADPQLLAQLETAAAMSQLVQMQQQTGEKAMQQPKSQQQNQMQQNERALNELLALYAASAAAASAFQQQDALKAKTIGGQNQQQQQQLAAQQAAAAAWLYNWEWMAAAQRMGGAVQNGQMTTTGGLANLLGGEGHQQFGKGTSSFGQTGIKSNNAPNGNAAAAAVAAALGIGLNNGTTMAMGNGQQKTAKNGQQNGGQTADAMLAKAAMSQLLIQAQQQQKQSTAIVQPKVEPAQQQNQAQKRKSPTAMAANEEVATNSLQVLADTAASTAAVERRMQQREETGGSPPKHARKDNQGQQQSTMTMGEREKALAESLVLYGMHRIAMELQLSYSVHANKGKAEYAFYCANGANGNANIQRMVTLTESADQILHIREYANGAVVAEECWPKSAEPYNLLSSLRNKCQRRLCTAQ